MAKQTTRTRTTKNTRPTPRTTQPRSEVTRLNARIDALERRIAILEARLPQTSLSGRLPGASLPKRGVILTQGQ